jgi:hypothetical protein
MKTSPWHATFLDALSSSGNVTAAARRAGVDRGTAYRARAAAAEFRAAWEEALEVATDALEAEARRRALEGWDEPVFFGGQECGRIRKYDSTLLMFLLKAHRPEKFRENSAVQHSGDLTIRIEYVDDPAAAGSWHSPALAGDAS